jgi:hypothetical protein
MTEDIIAAANVYWAKWEEPTEGCSINHDTPESIYLAKEMISNLSKESKELINLITNAPDEMFLANGRVSWGKLKKTLRKYKWSWKQVQAAQMEIQEIARNF